MTGVQTCALPIFHENAPGSQLVVLPQAAHLANLEQPEAFTRALEGFLARN